MTDKTVYVVFAGNGEYSDRTEWPVAAYRLETQAQEHVAAATEWLLQHPRPALSDYTDEKHTIRVQRWMKSNLYDPWYKGRSEYNFPERFWCAAVPMVTTVPKS